MIKAVRIRQTTSTAALALPETTGKRTRRTQVSCRLGSRFSGCGFPNGPLATVYAASNRDFRIVLATDAISGANDVGLAELARIGVYLMTSDQCLTWLARDSQVAAA